MGFQDRVDRWLRAGLGQSWGSAGGTGLGCRDPSEGLRDFLGAVLRVDLFVNSGRA